MQIGKLDHVNIRTNQLDAMIDWYTRILGLHSGARPDFPFPGAWIYAGESPVVHLIGVDDPGIGSESTLKLEHFAFAATDAPAFEANLNKYEEPYRLGGVESLGIIQYNLWDPDGNHIHVDFHANG